MKSKIFEFVLYLVFISGQTLSQSVSDFRFYLLIINKSITYFMNENIG